MKEQKAEERARKSTMQERKGRERKARGWAKAKEKGPDLVNEEKKEEDKDAWMPSWIAPFKITPLLDYRITQPSVLVVLP